MIRMNVRMHKRALSRALTLTDKAIGGRLAEERRRLGITQSTMAQAGGVKLRAQMYYEAGKRSPDALYLSRLTKIGVSVLYVLTGRR